MTKLSSYYRAESSLKTRDSDMIVQDLLEAVGSVRVARDQLGESYLAAHRVGLGQEYKDLSYVMSTLDRVTRSIKEKRK